MTQRGLGRRRSAARLATALSAVLALAPGCGGRGSDDSGPDPGAPDGVAQGAPSGGAGPDTSAVSKGAPTEAPPPPAPPQEPRVPDWRCPQGWSPSRTFPAAEAVEDVPELLLAHTHCRPPAPPAQACPPGLIRRLGEPECVPHGVPCPPRPEDWAAEEELRDRAPAFLGRVLYVAPGRRPGAGTRASPHASITEALGEAAPGDLVALAPAEYVEEVTFPGRVALLGACVAETSIVATGVQTADGLDATVGVRGAAGALITDLTVTGPGPGISVRGGDVTLRSLRLYETALLALNVADGPGVVTGEDLSFINTSPLDGTWGRGVLAFREGKLRLLRPSLHGNSFGALGADQPSSWVEAEDAIITGTRPHPIDGEGGVSLVATAGARMKLSRAWLEGNAAADIVGSSIGAVAGDPTLIEAEDVVVRNTGSGALPFVGNAFQVADGTHLAARRVVVEGTGAGLIYGSHRGTEMLMQDVVVRGRGTVSAGIDGVELGAHGTFRRLIIADCAGSWAEVAGPIFGGTGAEEGPPPRLSRICW